MPTTKVLESYTWKFAASAGALVDIALEDTEPLPSDNMGLLLDTVRLSVAPAPIAVLVGGFGVGLTGWLRRRRVL